MEAPLEGVVAVVTGGSRGIGKGIALELGAAGATVYVTGRTVLPGDHPLPGTIGDTAAAVTELGGHGVAVGCDHHVDGEVEAVFDRVMSEAGRLDLLVNNVFSSPTMIPWLGRPFWELPVAAWDETIDIGCRSHYVAARFAAPLLLANGRGLIVNVSSRPRGRRATSPRTGGSGWRTGCSRRGRSATRRRTGPSPVTRAPAARHRSPPGRAPSRSR